MKNLVGLAGTSLSLIGLYLVLKNAGGATKLLSGASAGTVDLFRTLQGR